MIKRLLQSGNSKIKGSKERRSRESSGGPVSSKSHRVKLSRSHWVWPLGIGNFWPVSILLSVQYYGGLSRDLTPWLGTVLEYGIMIKVWWINLLISVLWWQEKPDCRGKKWMGIKKKKIVVNQHRVYPSQYSWVWREEEVVAERGFQGWWELGHICIRWGKENCGQGGAEGEGVK